MTGRMVSEILSRLVETVAEMGEDMQGYVTELLLTLEAAVDSLESNFRPLDFMKEIFKSTPNLNNKDPQGHIIPAGNIHICKFLNCPFYCFNCRCLFCRKTFARWLRWLYDKSYSKYELFCVLLHEEEYFIFSE